MIGDWNVITMIPFDIPSLQVSLGHQRHLDFPVKRKRPSLCNLVPRAYVSFGQRQDTELWNNNLRNSKILGVPVSPKIEMGRSLELKGLQRQPQIFVFTSLVGVFAAYS